VPPAREINALLGSDRNRIKLSERAMRGGRTMDLAARRRKLAMREMPRWSAQAGRLIGSSTSFAPLTPDFAAVERMSEFDRMLQHSIYSVPDRRHGYCIDDNARALMLVSRMKDLGEEVRGQVG